MKLDCFYMLEGDDNCQININNGTLVNFKDIKSELYINNNHNIEKIDDNYLINISLLKYIDMCFHEMSPYIFNFIKNNNDNSDRFIHPDRIEFRYNNNFISYELYSG